MRNALITLLATLTLSSSACEISSGPLTTALVELYTSEGCNSCPPADQWFSRNGKVVNNASAVWLSFHVDYWDYIGWKDRFASPAFGERQHALVAKGSGSTVYTPQVFVNGHDASWRRGEVADAVTDINRRPARANLSIRLDPQDKDEWKVSLAGAIKQPGRSQQIWLAVYEDGFTSDVLAGENSGVKLHHDRVVRQWLGPFRLDALGNIRVSKTLNTSAINTSQAGVAGFVEDNATGEILQAIQLPFCSRS